MKSPMANVNRVNTRPRPSINTARGSRQIFAEGRPNVTKSNGDLMNDEEYDVWLGTPVHIRNGPTLEQQAAQNLDLANGYEFTEAQVAQARPQAAARLVLVVHHPAAQVAPAP